MRPAGATCRGRQWVWTPVIRIAGTARATDCQAMPMSMCTWIPGAPAEAIAKYPCKGCPRNPQSCAYTHESIQGSHGAATGNGRSANFEARGNRVGAQSHYSHGLPMIEGDRPPACKGLACGCQLG